MTLPFVIGSGHLDFFPAFSIGAPTDTNLSTFSLIDSYVYATSGRAMCFIFKSPQTGNITEIGVVPSSFTGTWNDTDQSINFEVREGLNGNRIPGTTLIGTGTIALTPTDAGRWVIKTGISISLVAGRMYCLVLYDQDGNNTNFVTMQASRGAWSGNTLISNEWGSTTNGFSSAYTATGAIASIYLLVGNRSIVGAAMHNHGTFSGGMNRRGNKFRLPFDAWIVGALNRTDSISATYGVLELYADGTAPGGPKLLEFEMPTQAGTGTTPNFNTTVMFPESICYRLQKNKWYRFVLKPPSSQTTPRRAQWISGANSNLIRGRQPWEIQWTIENGSSWNDDADWVCTLRPLLIPDNLFQQRVYGF